MFTFVSIFLLLGVVYLALGVAVSLKIKNVKDYFLAGRDLGLAALTFTLVATQIGGGMLLGSADAAYRDGYLGIFYSIGMSIGFLLLGFGLGAKLRSFNVVTTAQLFQVKYGSIFLRRVASVISAASMIGIFAGQVVASRLLFNVLGIGSEAVLLLFWLFVVAYTVMGGLKAVVVTDMFQVVFLICIVTGIFLYVISGDGISAISFAKTQAKFSSFGSSFSRQLPILFTSAIYPLFGQDLAQRFFAARTKKIAALAAILASVVIIAFAFVPVYFGMKAKFLGLTIASGTSVFYSVMRVLTNDLVLALVGCALIAAITSTADSLLCAVSSNISQDFDIKFSSRSRQLLFSKGVTCISAVIGIFIAYFSRDILFVLSQSYGLLIACLFIPVLFCFFSKSLSRKSALYSVLGGASSFVVMKLALWQGVLVTSEMTQILVPLGVSLCGFIFGRDRSASPGQLS